MKNSFKKFASLLLTFIMLVTLIPTTIVAETKAKEAFNISIQDANGDVIEVSKYTLDESYNVVDVVAKDSGTIPTGGSFTYDADTYTLTLTDANITNLTVECKNGSDKTVFNLKLSGTNLIDNRNSTLDYSTPSIYVGTNTNMVLEEGATLDIYDNGLSGIEVSNNLTITGGKINILECSNIGIIVGVGDINLINTDIRIIGKDEANTTGIYLTDVVGGYSFNSKNSKIFIKTTGRTIQNGTLSVLEGSINFDNTEAFLESTNDYGITSNTDITIKNKSKINVKGLNCGIFAMDSISIDDSQFVGETEFNNALAAFSGNISIDNSKLKLVSGDKYLINTDNGKILVDGIEKTKEDYVDYYVDAADYSAVESAIAAAEAIENKELYSNYDAVQSAVDAVVKGKDFTEQEVVDGYAAAITNAINALTYIDADYTKVDAAIAKANGLNKDEYKDFSKVIEAINAVVRGKNITEQGLVDSYAEVIEKAISELEKKPAPKPESKPETKPSYIVPNTCTK